MTTTLPLFDFARARRDDPATAKDAAADVNVTASEAMVLAALMRYGPQTEHEVAALVGRDRVSISPRFAPLRDKGLIEDSGERRANPATGKACIVWRLK